MSTKKTEKNTKSSAPIKQSMLVSIFAFTIIAFAAAFIQTFILDNSITLKNSSLNSIAYAQINSKTGSSTTLIGDTNIPYTSSNDTKTTVVDNATKSNISTSIDRSAIALNSTDANNFAKEAPTAPISPTGISTEGLQQPPDHRILNNTIIPSGK